MCRIKERLSLGASALALAAASAVLLSLSPSAAQATVVLLANSDLTGSSDLSGLSGNLESGLPANVLGGLGSGFAYAGGNTFLGVPDRGPNADPYAGGGVVDNTTSFISRFDTFTMTLTTNGGPGLPLNLAPTLTGTTLLWSATPLNYGNTVSPNGAPPQNTANKFYFTGRSDNFSGTGSGNPDNGRFDPESIRLSNDGKSVFISDEYGPYVYQFDRATGERIRSFTLPSNLYVNTLSSQGAVETSTNTSGRTDNKGMEALAITPDGKTLVGVMQAALIQDANGPNKNKNLLRFVTIDIATGTTHEYGYLLTAGTGVSDIVALNDHEFLVDERDGKGLADTAGSKAVAKKIYKIDISGAQDISGDNAIQATAKAVSKTEFADLVKILHDDNGIDTTLIPAKLEGIALGPDVDVGGTLEHTLWVANDNDFEPTFNFIPNPSQFYVFGFGDPDLAGSALVAQEFVPEPVTLALFASGLGGLFVASRRRRRSD